MTSKNSELADEREKGVKKEQASLNDREAMEARHRADQQKRGDEFERLDRWYREELEAEKERHRRQLADQQQRHATAFEKQERDFIAQLTTLTDKNRREIREQQDAHARETKQQEDRFIAQLKELHDRLAAQETAHIAELKRQQDDAVRREQALQEEIRSLNQTYKINLDKLTQEMESLRIEKDTEIKRLTLVMEEQRSSYELRINELELTLERYQQMTVKLESTVLELNTRLAQKEDVEDQLAMWKEHHDSMEQSKQELQEQLEGASAYINQLEDKFYESQTTQLEMLKQMKEYEAEVAGANNEIEQLRQYIIDLKSRIAVYIPVKGDTIDKKLAEYINNYPDRQKLKIMFMRETEGVYQFGTKRVAVRCVRDKIEIRVGGGFLSLDEFLDQYTPVELEKLERKDPMRRMTDRIALQKTLMRADSPQHASPQRSPKKKRAV